MREQDVERLRAGGLAERQRRQLARPVLAAVQRLAQPRQRVVGRQQEQPVHAREHHQRIVVADRPAQRQRARLRAIAARRQRLRGRLAHRGCRVGQQHPRDQRKIRVHEAREGQHAARPHADRGVHRRSPRRFQLHVAGGREEWRPVAVGTEV